MSLAQEQTPAVMLRGARPVENTRATALQRVIDGARQAAHCRTRPDLLKDTLRKLDVSLSALDATDAQEPEPSLIVVHYDPFTAHVFCNAPADVVLVDFSVDLAPISYAQALGMRSLSEGDSARVHAFLETVERRRLF